MIATIAGRLGPTHEETLQTSLECELKSYKQLSVTLYQIQDKFCDERRPRFWSYA